MQISNLSNKQLILPCFRKNYTSSMSSASDGFKHISQVDPSKPLNNYQIQPEPKIKQAQKSMVQLFNLIVKDKSIEETFFSSIANGDFEAVEFMLENEMIYLQNGLGAKALSMAIDSTSEMVDLLLAYGVKVDQAKCNQLSHKSLWFRACNNGSVSLVKALLEEKSMSVDHTDYSGNSPVIIASINVNTSLVELLIEHGAKATSNLVSCMYKNGSRSKSECLSFVTMLFKHGLNPNARLHNGLSFLHLAIEKNDIEMLQKFLEEGADINAECLGLSPLYYALQQKEFDIEVVKLLLDRGVQPKILTKSEIEVILDYRNRLLMANLDLSNDEILNLLSNHNPDVKKQLEKLAEKDKQEKFRKLEGMFKELHQEFEKVKPSLE